MPLVNVCQWHIILCCMNTLPLCMDDFQNVFFKLHLPESIQIMHKVNQHLKRSFSICIGLP